MSGDANRSSAEPGHTPAAEVSFSSYADARRHGEGSSLAGSRASGERWSEKGERLKERFLTPDRRSEDGGSGDSGSEKKRRSRIRMSGGGGGGGGFLRDSVFGNSTPKSSDRGSERKAGKKRQEQDGLHLDPNRLVAGNRMSGESSTRSSPLSREVSITQSTNEGTQSSPPTAASAQNMRQPTTTMDPAQLVQMALSLSESRKRHVSGSLPVPVAPRSRQVSGAGDRYGTVRTRGSERPRVSSHLNTPSPGSSSRSRDRYPSPTTNPIDDNVLYTFSPATLARAEKARKYFELANEHRRLLQNLPPLKPDADASGNYTFESRSSPGYAQAEIRRVRSNTTSKQELGRQYNPLQTLRNRRLRNKQQRSLTIPPELFSDTDRVASWLDDVEESARWPSYRTNQDVVNLPYYAPQPGEDRDFSTSKGHRRTETAGSVITKPENDWTVDPTERLADTYWTEQGDNKFLIENRRRQAIFPPRAKPDVENARRSAELSRQNTNSDDKREASQKEERPRKHRPTLALRKADGIRYNRLSRLKHSASTSSISSDEGRKPRSVGNGTPDSLKPLNKHMEAMIAREQRGETSSPDTASPDHWDSKHTPFPTRKDKRSSLHGANGSLSVNSTDSHQRSKSADGRLAQLIESEQPRFSFDSTPPSSPIVTDFVPSLAMDFSPPSKQTHKHKYRMLPRFHSKNKDRGTTEGRDFAVASESERSREPSGNAIDPTRLSAEYPRPGDLHRHKTSDSIASSIHKRGISRTQTGTDSSIKEPGSTVGRFFKGGRIAELVRNDRKGRKDMEGSTTDVSVLPSDASDSDDSADERSHAIGSPNDSEPSPRTSIDPGRNKQRLHIPNLPTFKSTSGRDKPASSQLTPVISNEGEDSDHISRQAAARREASRSPRMNRLMPPRISLPADDDFVSNADAPSQTSEVIQAEPKRKSYGFLAPNGGSTSELGSTVSFDNTTSSVKRNGNYPVTGLSRVGADRGRRHWSISDRGMREQQRQDLLKSQHVSRRDLARARALLLASGIKAHSLVNRANTPAPKTPSFLVAAAKTTSVDPPSVPLKETHLRAATMLSSHLDRSFKSISSTQQTYQSTTSIDLHTRLSDLKSLAADKLTQLVHNSSDEADAFGVRLTTEQTLRIKQVDDAVDEMLRLRRKQFRLLRRTGFKILEWMVLGLMWWVWFVVVCFNTVKKIILGIIRALRWLFTL
ncbi:hypothetical protein WHR41_03354 [Cladosporium halotolerans]|uniref:Uncharacterized protein n=1 Tax=Cladosporium halotolerans TaxID=1052096 RepID=A0AB34KUY6_9PEZI